ncbi:hypothetical protein Nmel_015506 [Mimus melanotis]
MPTTIRWLQLSGIVPRAVALALGAVTARVCGDLTASWLGGSRLMDVVSPYEDGRKLQDQL